MATLLLLLCLVVSFLMPLYWVYKPPRMLIRYFQYRWPDVLFQVNTDAKIIALTIDDAPSEYTREIMHVLKENDARAMFFVIGGQTGGREAILKDLVLAGNELGNHAMRDEPSRSLSNTLLMEQVHKVEEIITKAYTAAGVTSHRKYFRPGSGLFNDKMRESLARLGYQMVLGSIYPHDPQIPYWQINANHILSMARPGGIIICHDRRSWTAPMLRKVLPELKRLGYRIVPVTDLLKAAGT